MTRNTAALKEPSRCAAERLIWQRSQQQEPVVCIEKLFTKKQLFFWQQHWERPGLLDSIIVRLHVVLEVCQKNNPKHRFSLRYGMPCFQGLTQLDRGDGPIIYQGPHAPEQQGLSNLVVILDSKSHADCLIAYAPPKPQLAQQTKLPLYTDVLSYQWLRPGQAYLIDQRTPWQFLVRGPRLSFLGFHIVMDESS